MTYHVEASDGWRSPDYTLREVAAALKARLEHGEETLTQGARVTYWVVEVVE